MQVGVNLKGATNENDCVAANGELADDVYCRGLER